MAFLEEREKRIGQNRSQAVKEVWRNPSPQMIMAHLFAMAAWQEGNKKWREEHPEEWAAISKSGRASGQIVFVKWCREHPEEVAANHLKALEAAKKWQKEHPEEFLANSLKALAAINQQNTQNAAAKWREEHPEETLANSLKALDAAKKWRAEHSEEWTTHLEKFNAIGIAAAAQWSKEHPEEAAAKALKASDASNKWREEHPEEAAVNLEKLKVAGQIGSRKWRQEQPEEFAAISASARTVLANAYAKVYLERLYAIKPLIPETGIRLCELRKRFPQWTRDQIAIFLQKAVKQGDLIRVDVGYNNSRYYLPAEEKAA